MCRYVFVHVITLQKIPRKVQFIEWDHFILLNSISPLLLKLQDASSAPPPLEMPQFLLF